MARRRNSSRRRRTTYRRRTYSTKRTTSRRRAKSRSRRPKKHLTPFGKALPLIRSLDVPKGIPVTISFASSTNDPRDFNVFQSAMKEVGASPTSDPSKYVINYGLGFSVRNIIFEEIRNQGYTATDGSFPSIYRNGLTNELVLKSPNNSLIHVTYTT